MLANHVVQNGALGLAADVSALSRTPGARARPATWSTIEETHREVADEPKGLIEGDTA